MSSPTIMVTPRPVITESCVDVIQNCIGYIISSDDWISFETSKNEYKKLKIIILLIF